MPFLDVEIANYYCEIEFAESFSNRPKKKQYAFSSTYLNQKAAQEIVAHKNPRNDCHKYNLGKIMPKRCVKI